MIKAFVISVLLVSSVGWQLEKFLSSPVLKTAPAGVVVRPLGGGEVVSHQADLVLIPASTLKVVTTATALQALGPGYVFEARLFLKGDDLGEAGWAERDKNLFRLLREQVGKEFVFAVMINNPLDSPMGIVEKFLSALVLKE